MPKSRNIMTIPSQRSHNRDILFIWHGFRHLQKTLVYPGWIEHCMALTWDSFRTGICWVSRSGLSGCVCVSVVNLWHLSDTFLTPPWPHFIDHSSLHTLLCEYSVMWPVSFFTPIWKWQRWFACLFVCVRVMLWVTSCRLLWVEIFVPLDSAYPSIRKHCSFRS